MEEGAPIATLATLASWAALPPVSSVAPVEPLTQVLLANGRPALLSRLKAIGITNLSERQALAGALQQAIRSGHLQQNGSFPVDFEAAIASWPDECRRSILDEASSLPTVQALLRALQKASNRTGSPATPEPGSLPSSAHVEAEVGHFSSSSSRRNHELLKQHRAIGAAGCAALRRAVDERRSTAKDSVDKAAEHQLNLSPEELEVIIGRSDFATIVALPSRLHILEASGGGSGGGSGGDHGVKEGGADGGDDCHGDGVCDGSGNSSVRQLHGEGCPLDSFDGYRLEVFVRRYSRETRPWIQFHCDHARFTVNVALADDALHDGGRLLVAVGADLQRLERAEGEATCHSSSTLHAVSATTEGVRYSLICFFHELGAASDERADNASAS